MAVLRSESDNTFGVRRHHKLALHAFYDGRLVYTIMVIKRGIQFWPGKSVLADLRVATLPELNLKDRANH